MDTTMYRLLLVAILCRAAFSATTTPNTPFVPNDTGDGPVVDTGGGGAAETDANKNGDKTDGKKTNEMSGHNAEEVARQRLQKAYEDWLKVCAESSEIPEIPDELSNYLDQLGKTEDDLKSECEERKSTSGKRRKRLLQAGTGKWTKCIVPFQIQDSLSDSGRNAIAQVHEMFLEKSGFRFVEFNHSNTEMGLDHNNSLLYKDGGGCWSYVGNLRWNGQNISPCGSFGVALHEIGHALGFLHEHNDPASFDLMKPNHDNINDGSHNTYTIYNIKNVENETLFYDMTSEMSYRATATKKGYGYMLMTDEPALTKLIAKGDHYYMLKELQEYHECYAEFPSCSTMPVCNMGGYPSIVNGVCTCACPEALDTSNKCDTPLAPPTVTSWPAGTFGLVKVTGSSCPSGFGEGQAARWNSAWVWNGGTSLSEGRKSGEEFVFDYCTQTTSSGSGVWPKGEYCLLQKGSCPTGFDEGLIKVVGKAPQRENSSYGVLPDGTKGQSYEYKYCCRKDGSYQTAVELPNTKPFIMFKANYWGCQKIKGMVAYQEFFVSRGNGTQAIFSGTLPFIYKFSDSLFNSYYCVYNPVSSTGCGVVKKFSADDTTYTFETPNYPNNYPTFKECFWHFESPVGTKMKIEFSDFEVSELADSNCKSHVTLKTVMPGMTGYTICGHNEKKTRLTVYNSLTVKFFSSYNAPQKGFRATVTVLKETDQCYPGDGKNTYVGTMDYTHTMKKCLPWSQVTNCALNKFSYSASDLNLVDNHCHTVKTGRIPWCYVNKELCEREYCDVCKRDSCYDVLPNCAGITQADSQFCTTNELGEAKQKCRKTCGFCSDHTAAAAYSTISCSAPGAVTSINPTPSKASYNVGDEVTYSCSSTSVVQKRTCQSDGTWTHLGFVCSGCSEGWTYVRGKCYQWQKDKIQKYNDAKATCEGLSSNIMVVESDDQLNGVLALTNYDKLGNNNLWLGLSYVDGAWKWEEGTSTYSSWKPGTEKKTNYCVVGKGPNTWESYWCGWKSGVVCGKTPSGTFECIDDLPNCSDILAETPDYCETYPDHAWANCRNTCGVTGCTGTSTCSVTAVTNGEQTQGASGSVDQGKYVEYKCSTGYYLSAGNLKRTCLSTGSFNGAAPVCSAAADVDSVTLFTDVELFRRSYYNDLKYPVVANLDTTKLTVPGKVTAWTFFASEAGDVTMLVWRPVANNNLQFTLVGKNTLTVTADNRAVKMDVAAGDQITVQENDVIGLVMTKPVITFNHCSKSNVPQFAPWLTTPDKYSAADLTVNTAYTFQEYSKSCRIYSIHKYSAADLTVGTAYTFQEYSKSCRVYSIHVTINPSGDANTGSNSSGDNGTSETTTPWY